MAMMNVKKLAKSLDEQPLPDDLVTDIFERLPVKSLMRFKCVSKYWCKQIKSPLFIKNHLLKQQQSDHKVLLLWSYFLKKVLFSFRDPESKDLGAISSKLAVPFMQNRLDIAYTIDNHDLCLLGPCNGLVCMFHRKRVALCNPALREYKELPCCPPFYHVTYRFKNEIGHGFGFTCTGDYKVVLVRGFMHVQDIKAGIQFHVYNLSTNSWGTIDSDTNVFPVSNHPCSQIFFNGLCHWKTLSYHGKNPHHSILSFDLSTENVGQLEYPDILTGINQKKFDPYLMIANDCFGFVLLAPKGGVEIWVMKEYSVNESWTKQSVMGPYPNIVPLVLWKNDNWLFAKIKRDLYRHKRTGSFAFNEWGGRFVSCALNERRMMRRFNIKGVEFEDSLQALNYKESLISLDDIIKSVPMIKLD